MSYVRRLAEEELATLPPVPEGYRYEWDRQEVGAVDDWLGYGPDVIDGNRFDGLYLVAEDHNSIDIAWCARSEDLWIGGVPMLMSPHDWRYMVTDTDPDRKVLMAKLMVKWRLGATG